MRVRIYVMLGHKYQNEHRITLNDIEQRWNTLYKTERLAQTGRGLPCRYLLSSLAFSNVVLSTLGLKKFTSSNYRNEFDRYVSTPSKPTQYSQDYVRDISHRE